MLIFTETIYANGHEIISEKIQEFCRKVESEDGQMLNFSHSVNNMQWCAIIIYKANYRIKVEEWKYSSFFYI